MKTSPNDVSNQEVLTQVKEILGEVKKLHVTQAETVEAVQALAQHMDEEFLKVRADMATKTELRMVKNELQDDLQREIGKVRAVMVTKDYLDQKLADQHSDIIQHTRKEIEKALR